MLDLFPLAPPSDRIDVQDAFLRVNQLLLVLLESLLPHEWVLPTVHKTRHVKDLVAHLVDGSLRRLSLQRDHWQEPNPTLTSFGNLVEVIQSLNREWMGAAQRLSPRILIELARKYDQELFELFQSLDPDGQALFPVAWAGEDRSKNWFDIAREYTEKWHHQQQIRDATGRPPLYESSLLAPVLETFVRGLPYAYRAVQATPGTTVLVIIEGPLECAWTLRKESSLWRLYQGLASTPTVSVRVHADRAWRLWTKGLSPGDAEQALVVHGDWALANPLLSFTAIMA